MLAYVSPIRRKKKGVGMRYHCDPDESSKTIKPYIYQTRNKLVENRGANKGRPKVGRPGGMPTKRESQRNARMMAGLLVAPVKLTFLVGKTLFGKKRR